MHRAGLREALLAVVVAALVSALFAAVADAPQLRGLETASFDLRMSLRGPRAPGPEVALVLVDDRSLAALGRWPFSRQVFAEAVDRLTAAGARVVVFDLLFSEPEQPVPADVRSAARTAAAAPGDALPPALRAALDRLAADDPDAALAGALARSGLALLAFAFVFEPAAPGATVELPAGAAYGRFVPTPDEAVFPLQPASVIPPLARLSEAAAGLGHVTIAYDRDGAPRYEYLALPYDADFYPPLSVRAVARYLGVPWGEVGLALGRGVSVGPLTIATDRAMRLLINYRGPRGTFPTFSFVDLMTGAVPAGALKDRIVLVGAAATGINDTFRTPFGSSPLPGVERMANVIDTMLHRDFIERPTLLVPAEIAAVLVLALAGGLAASLVPTRAALPVGLAPAALWAGAAQYALTCGVWLDLVAPAASLIAAMLAVLLFRYAVVDREGRRVRTAFRHYLAPALVN